HYSSLLRKRPKDLPSCRNISMYNVPWSTTPGKLSLSCHGENDSVAFYTPECIGLPNLHEISELNPFNLSAYGPLPNCLRLNTDVTICPPRLVPSVWLVLSRPESPQLSFTTYAQSGQWSSCIFSAANDINECQTVPHSAIIILKLNIKPNYLDHKLRVAIFIS